MKRLFAVWISRQGEQMETNDLTAKNFETYPDVAADIINVLIYEGSRGLTRTAFCHHRQRQYIREEKI